MKHIVMSKIGKQSLFLCGFNLLCYTLSERDSLVNARLLKTGVTLPKIPMVRFYSIHDNFYLFLLYLYYLLWSGQ